LRKKKTINKFDFPLIQSNDVVIRRDGDDRLIIADDKCLRDYNIVDGTEIAFFKYSDYQVYKENPDLIMD